MSFDLYERETQDRLAAMPPVQNPEPGAFDGFMRGTGLATMKGLARVGRSIDMLGAVAPVAYDAFTGGTEAQTQYFKEHDDAWGSAVDYWTPKPGEVGVAAEVTGQLLSTLPVVIASPGLAVADLQLGTAEDLVKKGVSAGKAQAVGAVQGLGLGLGIWMPILGSNGWQRLVVGGAGFNVLQGVTTRAASGLILEGTPAAKDFEAFNGEALTLDVLLGLAFGGLAHINPAMRAQGKEAWTRLEAWAQKLQPSDVAAIAALRQAQHLNVDSAPGKPAAPADVEAHVARVRQAIEQISRGEHVEVSDLPQGQFERDSARAAENDKRAAGLQREGEALAKANGIVLEEPSVRGFHGTKAEIEVTDLSKSNDLGPHFTVDRGTAEIFANDLGTKGKVLEGDMRFRKVLDMPDLAGWQAWNVANWLDEQGLTNRKPGANGALGELGTNALRASEQAGKPGSDVAHAAAIGVVKKWLRGEGYDAIRYKNEFEGKSADTYIALDMSRVTKTEGPAGQPRGAEPPPPRGPSEGKPAGPEVLTPERVKADLQERKFAFLPKQVENMKYNLAQLEEELPGLKADAARKVSKGDKVAAGQKRNAAEMLKRKQAAAAEQRAELADAEDMIATGRRPDVPDWEVDFAIEGMRADAKAGAGAEAPDPLALEADRIVKELPERLLRVGSNPDGTPIHMTAKEYLEGARADAKKLREDIQLVEIAAQCLLGGGR